MVLSVEDFKALTAPSGDLVDFFQESPAKGVTLDLKRTKDFGRGVSL